MPRGNDKDEALHELADRFGDGVGNAEQLIDANAAKRTRELATISELPVLQVETDELDLDELEGPDGEYVVDAVVRGSGRTRGIVVVFEDEGGRLHKHLAESTYDDTEQKGTRRSQRAGKNEDGESPKGDA